MPVFGFLSTATIPSATTPTNTIIVGTGASLRGTQAITATGPIGSLQENGVVFSLSTLGLNGQATLEVPLDTTLTTTTTTFGSTTLTQTVTDEGLINLLDNNDGNDSFLLTLRNSFLGSNVPFTGTAGSPVVLGLSPFWQNGSFQVQFTNSKVAGGTVTRAVTQSVTQVSATGAFTGIVFSLSSMGPDAISLDSLSVKAVNCFAKGTLIDTPLGAVAVEKLSPGDTISTKTSSATVKWLGKQQIDTRLSHPAKVNPICITAGALGDGLPKRDLRLSADHAIEIDGALYNAGALVNGSTIFQERGKMPDDFTYYHVETDAHELLLAEGVAAETFIDYAGRLSFENAPDSDSDRPIAEMALPRISSARLVPEGLRHRLAPQRAA